MPETAGLKQATSMRIGRFEINQYIAGNMRVFAVQDTMPEKNLWNSICYILKFDNNHAIAIDPGFTNIDETGRLEKLMHFERCDVLLTHGHYDHTYGAARLVKNGRIIIHEKDRKYIEGLSVNPEKNKELAYELAVIREDPELKYDFIGHAELDIIHSRKHLLQGIVGSIELPDDIRLAFYNDGGHTIGHTIFVYKDIMFAGDVLTLGNEGKWYIECRFGKKNVDGKKDRSLRAIREKCRKTLKMILDDPNINYIALGHGGIMPRSRFKGIAEKVI